MNEFSLPDDFVSFLDDGKQLEYDLEDCEAGAVTLHRRCNMKTAFYLLGMTGVLVFGLWALYATLFWGWVTATPLDDSQLARARYNAIACSPYCTHSTCCQPRFCAARLARSMRSLP